MQLIPLPTPPPHPKKKMFRFKSHYVLAWIDVLAKISAFQLKYTFRTKMDFWDLLEILESNMKKSFESRFESEHSLVIDAVAN